ARLERAAVRADVFAHEEDALIAGHLFEHGRADGVEVGGLTHPNTHLPHTAPLLLLPRAASASAPPRPSRHRPRRARAPESSRSRPRSRRRRRPAPARSALPGPSPSTPRSPRAAHTTGSRARRGPSSGT